MTKRLFVILKTFAVIAFFSNLMLGEARAATQGTIGATSTGSLNISITKPPRANITSLSDLTTASWTIGSGDEILISDVCVYSTRPNGGYTVQATGSGAAGAFSLSDGSNTLNYSISWNSGGVGNLSNTGSSLTSTITSAALTNAATDSSTCNGTSPGPTARLIATIPEPNLTSVIAGTYTGTLTLLVTPN